jgi:hypothetical protein
MRRKLLFGLLASSVATTLAAHAANLTLESPAAYQVFQRQSRLQGKIVVRGHWSEGCDAAEVRLTSASAPSAWLPLQLESGCAFQGEMPAAAGGWYGLEVRVLQRGNRSGGASVEHIGVGETFVICGQSNSTNYGEELQQTRTGMVSTFSGDAWRVANDPQPGVQDNSQRGSFIPAFGDALYERYKVPIGIASVGAGGTSVRQWLPKGDRFLTPPTMSKYVIQVGEKEWESSGRLFDGMLERIRQLGRGGFRALLWHQGESDANQVPGHEMTPADYRRMLERIVRESRRQAGWEFPWLVAQATYHNPAEALSPEIREAQASLWKDGIALEGPDTDILTGDNRQNGGKGVHLSGKGLEAHGKMWAEKVERYLDGILGPVLLNLCFLARRDDFEPPGNSRKPLADARGSAPKNARMNAGMAG